jgi:hypothetical protein
LSRLGSLALAAAHRDRRLDDCEHPLHADAHASHCLAGEGGRVDDGGAVVVDHVVGIGANASWRCQLAAQQR